MKIGMISLGCDKNRVDSENMLYLLQSAGHTLVDDAKEAEIIIINTCAFIDEAKKETINTVLEMSKLKEQNLQKLVVTGCFAQRYRSNVNFPEVDLFLDIAEEKDIVHHIDTLIGTKANAEKTYAKGRVLTTPAHYAYLKIADGCNNACSYCAIPSIRGKYISTPIEELVSQAKDLLEQGVKELILVAQDTTNYGIDLYKERKLLDLLKELVKLDFWKIRILYTYPELIDNELLTFINKEDKIAKYLDIPMQHIDDNILKKMNRRSSQSSLITLVKNIRENFADISIRSTFIVGFPYESKSEYKNLEKFIDGTFDYAGFFIYSPEEGTKAYGYGKRANSLTCKIRKNLLEKIQSKTTILRQQKYINTICQVIYEGIDYERQCFFGRTEYQAPQVDTKVYFTSDFPLDIGNIYNVYIEKADFNLYGKTVK